jgi:hypothetical protein
MLMKTVKAIRTAPTTDMNESRVVVAFDNACRMKEGCAVFRSTCSSVAERHAKAEGCVVFRKAESTSSLSPSVTGSDIGESGCRYRAATRSTSVLKGCIETVHNHKVSIINKCVFKREISNLQASKTTSSPKAISGIPLSSTLDAERETCEEDLSHVILDDPLHSGDRACSDLDRSL